MGAGPLLPAIQDDLGISHAVAGLLATIPVLCMGVFAPAAAPLARRSGLRSVVTVSVAVVAVFGLAAVPEAGVLWTVLAGLVIGAVFPLCLTMCLDVAHEPVAAGAAAALMLLGGYLVAGLAPFGLGVIRDFTGSFSASLWALSGTALLLVAACLPLTATRLRPV